MALPHPQNAADWVTQSWNIALGRRMDSAADGWLQGPIGKPGETAETFIERLAAEENLHVARNVPGTGLLEDFSIFGVAVHPAIAAFYTRTTAFEMRARTRWNPVFAGLGALVAGIFSRRIQQLHLPGNRTASALGITSEIITLSDAAGRPVYRVWYRRIRESGEVIFYGIYTHCQIPSGEHCLKVIFPLPHGSATVVLRLLGAPDGSLTLLSEGQTYGDPGFYFLVEDRAGARWKHHLRGFREKLVVSAAPGGQLEARHSMSLYRLPVYEMRYEITGTERAAPVGAPTADH